jgi:chorismate mutase
VTERALVAVRGAITVAADQPRLIRAATHELLAELEARNDITPAHIVSALFTMTSDLISEVPARAARERGWADVPMLCAVEVPVPDSLPRCIRVLLHAWAPAPGGRGTHIYLGEAQTLRPELGTG